MLILIIYSWISWVIEGRWEEVDLCLHKQSGSLKDVNLENKSIRLYKRESHFRDCVISGKEPIARAEVTHRSITIAHLGNISMMLNQDLGWDPKTERFVNNAVANAMLDRPMREPWGAIFSDFVVEL